MHEESSDCGKNDMVWDVSELDGRTEGVGVPAKEKKKAVE